MTQVAKVLPNAQIGQGYGGQRPVRCALLVLTRSTVGMTETSASVAMFPTETRIGVTGSSGRLLPGVVVRVLKADGTLAGFNELGELHVKIPSLALGYWNNEEA